jgi:hypothetical protein
MVAMSALTSFVDGTIPHQGDLNNYGTNIDTLCQLTTGKTAASGVSSKPMCKVAINANLGIATNVDAVTIFNVANYNTDNMWVASQPTQVTIQTAGKYRVVVQGDWAANATNTRSVKILVNGTTNSNAVASCEVGAAPINDTIIQAVACESLAIGATVYMGVNQNSGGSLNLGTSLGGTFMIVEWVAPY